MKQEKNGSSDKRLRRLVFHIGDHKTGTTSIQNAFARGQVEVDGRPVYYPTRLGHNFLRALIRALGRKSPLKRSEAEEKLSKLAQNFRNADADSGLLSAESLELVEPEALRDMIERFFSDAADEIRIIAYVRPHAPRFLSSYAEQVKIGNFQQGLQPFLEFMQQDDRLNYHPRFTAWRETFGEAFILRPMIGSVLRNGDVLQDFAYHALGPEARITGTIDQANESLSLEDLMRLKVLQAHLGQYSQTLRLSMGWEFARLVATLPASGPRTRLQLHKALAEQLYDSCLDDARAMDRDFLGGSLLEDELRKTRDTAAETAQDLEPEAWFSASELRTLRLMSDLTAGLLDNELVDWPQMLRSKRILTLHGGED